MKRNNLVIIIFILLFYSLLFSTETVTIIYTHNSNGILQNCNCPKHAYGALEKRATVIDSIREADKNVILVDTGDMFSVGINPRRHTYMLRGYQYMNYDFFVPGDQDFVEGCKFLLNDVLPVFKNVLGTNLAVEGQSIGEKKSVVKFDRVTIGLTGTMEPDLKKYMTLFHECDIEFSDRLATLKPVVQNLNSETDFTIVLSHAGYDNDIELIKRCPGINVLIGGHSQTILEEGHKIENTLIVQAGESGYRVGVLKLYFDDGSLKNYDNKLILLDNSVKDHPALLKIINEYLKPLQRTQIKKDNK